MNSKKRQEQMQNAPFQFFPEDWFGFFSKLGWREREANYLADAGKKAGRPFPIPWFGKLLMMFASAEQKEKFRKMSAYVLLERF